MSTQELQLYVRYWSDELISGLALDWITGNLYGVSTRGIVFACKARVRGLMKCMVVLEGQKTLRGIALDPKNG